MHAREMSLVKHPVCHRRNGTPGVLRL
jgi:hypothetical protein